LRSLYENPAFKLSPGVIAIIEINLYSGRNPLKPAGTWPDNPGRKPTGAAPMTAGSNEPHAERLWRRIVTVHSSLKHK